MLLASQDILPRSRDCVRFINYFQIYSIGHNSRLQQINSQHCTNHSCCRVYNLSFDIMGLLNCVAEKFSIFGILWKIGTSSFLCQDLCVYVCFRYTGILSPTVATLSTCNCPYNILFQEEITS